MEEWKAYEQSVQSLMGCLRQHSAFDVIDGDSLKSFMQENLVMNYSNIELNRILIQQQQHQVDPHEDGNNFNSAFSSNQALGGNANGQNNARQNHQRGRSSNNNFGASSANNGIGNASGSG